ncbi:MAG: AAA family ATPase [Gemmatimonadales bacterium]
MIITISRQKGAGGAEVAGRVAEALGWRLVDNELVDRVAARAHLSPSEVEALEERAPSFFERLVRALTAAAPEIQPAPSEHVPELEEANLVKVTEAVVEDAAREGRVVLVGRAAPAVLSRERDALHVKIVAPLAARIAEVGRREGCDDEESRERIERSDANRRRYHERFYRRSWDDAANYHLVLNSAALGKGAVVDTIVGRAKTLWPNATVERRASG